MYEGRTRGKKLKYTYSDDEEIFSDDQQHRRSSRNQYPAVTSAESSRPRFTASGRQIRSRAGGLYGETLLTGQREDFEEYDEDPGRPQRNRNSLHPNGYSGYGADDLEDEDDARSSGNDSGNEWRSGEDDENDFEGDDEGEDASGDESIINGEPPSLVVQLRYGKGNASSNPTPPVDEPPPAQDTDASQVKEPANSAAALSTTSMQTVSPFFPSPLPQKDMGPTAMTDTPPASFVSTNQAETLLESSATVSNVPSAPTTPLSAPTEAPKNTQENGPNGMVDTHATSEILTHSEILQPHASSTQA